MKVIDLLNKIANTKDYKDIPKKIKITTGTLKEEYRIWVWDGAWYIYEEDGMDVCICTEKLDLNDEVEIIEDKPFNERVEEIYNRHIDYIYGKEDKKIPTLKNLNLTKIDINKKGQIYGVTTKEVVADIQTLQNWINKIIDYINKEK